MKASLYTKAQKLFKNLKYFKGKTYWYWILWVELKGDWLCVSILHPAAKKDPLDFKISFPRWIFSFWSTIQIVELLTWTQCKFQILNICLFFGIKRLNLLLGRMSVTNWKRKKWILQQTRAATHPPSCKPVKLDCWHDVKYKTHNNNCRDKDNNNGWNAYTCKI